MQNITQGVNEMTYADLLKELIEENKKLLIENERLKEQLQAKEKPVTQPNQSKVTD